MIADQKKEFAAFKELLLWVWDNHVKPWDSVEPIARKIHDELGTKWEIFGHRNQLEGLVRETQGDLLEQRRFLWLNAVTAGGAPFVPILSVKWWLGVSVPEVRLRLALFFFDDSARPNERVKGFGYRFETPEGTGDGMHDYYHTQLIRGISKAADFGIPLCPDWLPVVQPALPLHANSPVRLFLAMLVSLYGAKETKKLQAHEGNVFKTYLDDLLPPYKVYFWRVNDSGKVHFYRTALGNFEAEFRKENKPSKKCIFEEIDKTAFEASSKSARSRF
jgi:hypothetical protein